MIPGVPEARAPSWRFSVGIGIAALGGIAPPLTLGASAEPMMCDAFEQCQFDKAACF